MSEAPFSLAPARERVLLGTLAAVQFTHVMDFMVMMPLGPQLMRVFGLTPAQFTYLVASYGLAAAVTGFLGGFVLDRFGRRRALLTLFAGFGLATLACALAPTYGTLLAARTVAGGFGGVAGSVVVAIVGDVIPPDRRGRAMGIVMTAFPLASVLGIPTALALASTFEWHAPFFLLAALSVGVLLLARSTLPALIPTHPPVAPWQQMAAILSTSVHHKGLAMSAMMVFAGGCLIPFVAPTMVANAGLNESQLPWIYFGGGLATLFTNPWLGRLSDRHDKLHVLGMVTIAAAVVALVITRLPRIPLGTAMAVTAAFMVAMSGRFSPAMAMLTNAVEARYRGGFMSINSAVQQLASGLANVVAGLLVTQAESGRLEGFERAGYLSVVCLGLTYVLAARLKAAAPHASRPGARHPEAPPPAA